MKTSFASFQQEIFYRNGSYRRTIFIDCEQVKAVSKAIDASGNLVEGKCDIFITGSLYFTVIGEAAQVIATVRSYCKDRTS